jgi:hypothetical protein
MFHGLSCRTAYQEQPSVLRVLAIVLRYGTLRSGFVMMKKSSPDWGSCEEGVPTDVETSSHTSVDRCGQAPLIYPKLSLEFHQSNGAVVSLVVLSALWFGNGGNAGVRFQVERSK